jgi:hypothetical protein
MISKRAGLQSLDEGRQHPGAQKDWLIKAPLPNNNKKRSFNSNVPEEQILGY